MTFNGAGVYSFAFNVATNFVYNGTSNLELLIENRGGNYRSQEPWFDRINDAGAGNFPGKVGWGWSWANATTVSSNRRFNLQINNVGCGGFPLPVTLKDAVASCQDGKAILEWETLSEINNDFFTIEKSYDGDNWRKIAKINGSGTTTSSSVYSFEDTEVNNSLTYYRLSQTDYNGDYEMLRVFALDCTSKTNVSVYPNPFKNELIVNKNNTTEVNVFNALGQKMYPSFSENSVSYIFNTTDFPKGVYIVQIVSDNITNSVRVVK